MKYKLAIFLIIILIAVPAIHADDWQDVTVNKVTFKVPEKFTQGEVRTRDTGYSQGEEKFFHITSLIKYESLKSVYGISATSDGIEDIEETEIDSRPCLVIYNHNDLYDYDYLDIFFPVGKKIFRIQYPEGEITDELKEIIKSVPESEMSADKLTGKLDSALSDYIEEDYEKNLALDIEEYYRDYEKRHDRHSFVSVGSDGWTFGHIYDY